MEADRRTADACRVRRTPIVLARAQQLSPKPMAPLVGCAVQTVRNVMHALNTRGMVGLEKPSPRTYDKPTGGWTLALAAELCSEQGVTERLRSAVACYGL